MTVAQVGAGVAAFVQGGADRVGEFGLDQCLVDGFGGSADTVTDIGGLECVEDFEQGRLVQGHRVVPLYGFLGGFLQRLTRWPLLRAQARRTGPGTYTTSGDATRQRAARAIPPVARVLRNSLTALQFCASPPDSLTRLWAPAGVMSPADPVVVRAFRPIAAAMHRSTWLSGRSFGPSGHHRSHGSSSPGRPGGGLEDVGGDDGAEFDLLETFHSASESDLRDDRSEQHRPCPFLARSAGDRVAGPAAPASTPGFRPRSSTASLLNRGRRCDSPSVDV